MKQYSYFPGCTLKEKARELDLYARQCAEKLGFSLQELPQWQCCGAVYPMASDEIAPKLSAVRALEQARQQGQDLVTVCAACHHVIKRVNDDMKQGGDIAFRANRYLGFDMPYEGQTKVLHYLEVLRDEIGFDAIRARVEKPLTGKKSGPIMVVCCCARRGLCSLMIRNPPAFWKTCWRPWEPSRWISPCAMNAAVVTGWWTIRRPRGKRPAGSLRTP